MRTSVGRALAPVHTLWRQGATRSYRTTCWWTRLSQGSSAAPEWARPLALESCDTQTRQPTSTGQQPRARGALARMHSSLALASGSSSATHVEERRKIIVACDGTWCGDAAGTTGNIKLMAESIASRPLANKDVFWVGTTVVGSYFDGVGLAGSADLPGLLEYLLDGAVANDIKDRCVEAYTFIVEHFTEGSEVWLLGLSRGAFTVRSVAGMINNFGILDKGNPKVELDPFCTEVYRMYRSRDKAFHPDAQYPADFKAEYCTQLNGRPPIKFMGLLDTVGSLGVPTVNAGFGLEFLFYDQVVSDQVENVYQALATHDVFFGFEPCFARRKDGTQSGVTREVWFPGAHWDLGRQRFVPFRTTGGPLERAIHYFCDVTNWPGINVEPTLECSVEPLKWMLRCMRQTDPSLISDTGYDEAVKSCLQVPWEDRFPLARRALKKNALETLNDRFFRRFSPLFAGLALRDRQIPEYSDANIIGKEPNGADNESAFINPESGFNSKAYNRYQAVRSRGVKWVSS